MTNVRLWLLADIHAHPKLRPLYPRKRTLPRIEEKPGLKRCLSDPWFGVTKCRTETFRQFRPNWSPETVSWQQTTGKYRLKAAEFCHSSPSADWCVKTPRVGGGAHNTQNSNQGVYNASKSLMKPGQFVTFLKNPTNCENFKGNLLSQNLERYVLVAVSHLTHRIKSKKYL